MNNVISIEKVKNDSFLKKISELVYSKIQSEPQMLIDLLHKQYNLLHLVVEASRPNYKATHTTESDPSIYESGNITIPKSQYNIMKELMYVAKKIEDEIGL